MNDRSQLNEQLEQLVRAWGDEQLGAPPPVAALWHQLSAQLPASLHLSGEAPMSTVEQASNQTPPAPARAHQGRRNAFSIAAVLLVIAVSVLLFRTLHTASGGQPPNTVGASCTPNQAKTLDYTELTNLAMISPQEGWSAGEFFDPGKSIRGVIFHYQHCQWQQYSTHLDFTNISLGPVHMLSAQGGWMLGTLHSNPAQSTNIGLIGFNDAAGVIALHYAQGSWQQVPIPLAAPLKLGDIYPVSDQESWILGDTQAPGYNGPCCSLLLHEQDGVWAKEAIPSAFATFHFDVVAPVGPDDAWFFADAPTGDNYLLHEQHGTWTKQDLGANVSISAFQFLSTQNGWAAGVSYGAGSDPRRDPYLLHYDGTSWKTVSLPTQSNFQHYPQSISLDAPNDGWVAGFAVKNPTGFQENDPLFYHFTQGSWQQVQVTFPASFTVPSAGHPPAVVFSGVTTLAPDDAWANVIAEVQIPNHTQNDYHSFIFHYDGSQWKLVQQ
jgi:hypothetical protein